MNFEYDKLKSSISHLHASKPRLNYKITSIVPSKKKNPTQKLVTSFRQSIQTHKLQNNSKYKTSKNSPAERKQDKNDSINNSNINKTIKTNKHTFDNLLKRRILKIQQKNKKSITTLNTQNNSSNNTNSSNNKLPKRSNSAIGDDYYYNKRHSTPNNKNISPSSYSLSTNKQFPTKKTNKTSHQLPPFKHPHSVLTNIKQPSSVFSSHIKNFINSRKTNPHSINMKQFSSNFESKEHNSSVNNSTRLNPSSNMKKPYHIINIIKKPNSVRTSSTKLHQKIKQINKTKQQTNAIEIYNKNKHINKQNNESKGIQNDRNNIRDNNNNNNTKTKPSTNTKPFSSQHSTDSDNNDHDLNNTLNNNDSLLKNINLNLDVTNHQHNNNNNNNLNSSNLNNSFDSIYSSQFDSQKYMQYHIDMTIIVNYIKSYYKKTKEYPTTKMKFYKYGRLLGKGAFGKVNLSLHVLTGRLVAIKSINKSKIVSAHQRKKIIHETNIMKLLSNSNNIVRIYEMYETQKHICIVMEYICAGDLLSYIRKRNPINENICKYIFKQIILGLSFIHRNKIVHRDIKLDNILIDLDNNIKICDFGVSKRITNLNDKMNEQCGTPAYMAPEIIKGNGYEGYGADIWSAGVVLYALLSGTLPFKGKDLDELHFNILKGNFKDVKDISHEANHLLHSLLEIDVNKRITTEEILTHPWLINVDVNNNIVKGNLFTKAERVLLTKNNVDYRDISNRMDMIECFNIKNLDTHDEKQTKHNQTKSVILAPFNSSIDGNESCVYENVPLIENKVIRFGNCVREINRNYELNNNEEIDNGIIIISRQEQCLNDNNNNNNKIDDMSPFNEGDNFSSHYKSKQFTPKDYSNTKYKQNELILNDKIIKELIELGYSKQYVTHCLKNNDFNYCTASYFLLCKFA